MPKIMINGEPRLFSRLSTLGRLLSMLDVSPKDLVVEVNGRVVKSHQFGDIQLKEGDQIELIRFVGGG